MKPTEMLSQIKTLLKARMSLAQQTLENGTIIVSSLHGEKKLSP